MPRWIELNSVTQTVTETISKPVDTIENLGGASEPERGEQFYYGWIELQSVSEPQIDEGFGFIVFVPHERDGTIDLLGTSDALASNDFFLI